MKTNWSDKMQQAAATLGENWFEIVGVCSTVSRIHTYRQTHTHIRLLIILAMRLNWARKIDRSIDRLTNTQTERLSLSYFDLAIIIISIKYWTTGPADMLIPSAASPPLSLFVCLFCTRSTVRKICTVCQSIAWCPWSISTYCHLCWCAAL